MGDVLSLCQAVAVDSSQRLKLYDGFNQFLLLALAWGMGKEFLFYRSDFRPVDTGCMDIRCYQLRELN